MDANMKNEKVAAAIKAHFAWFERLRAAIDSGKSEFVPALVAKDNQCEFGKWIYADLKSICSQEKYDRIKIKHAEFHKKASEVLTLALNGKKDIALKQITSSSELGKISGELLIILKSI